MMWVILLLIIIMSVAFFKYIYDRSAYKRLNARMMTYGGLVYLDKVPFDETLCIKSGKDKVSYIFNKGRLIGVRYNNDDGSYAFCEYPKWQFICYDRTGNMIERERFEVLYSIDLNLSRLLEGLSNVYTNVIV